MVVRGEWVVSIDPSGTAGGGNRGCFTPQAVLRKESEARPRVNANPEPGRPPLPPRSDFGEVDLSEGTRRVRKPPSRSPVPAPPPAVPGELFTPSSFRVPVAFNPPHAVPPAPLPRGADTKPTS